MSTNSYPSSCSSPEFSPTITTTASTGLKMPSAKVQQISHTMAETMAAARDHADHADDHSPEYEEMIADEDSSSSASDTESNASFKSKTADFAFAFDIDGVLIKGGEVIPEAREAMKMLNGQNPDGIVVPYIFVTNGGGKPEQERCKQLSQQLDIDVSPAQFICGHTPMKDMSTQYKTVLVVGGEGEKCRQVAEGYGFTDVVTPGDIMKWNASVTPFRKLTQEEHDNSRDRDFNQINIDAIFVFADSRHWGDDAQIVVELLMSKNGRMGTVSPTHDEGPHIYFSHDDLLWATDYPLTRHGMGALKVMVQALYEQQTGKKLGARATSFGKPQLETFQYANRVLEQWRYDVFGDEIPLQTVYFVGDTPESDIQGANKFHNYVKEEWYSILVKTGVYQENTIPAHAPKATVANVLDAVKFGIERSKKTREKKLQQLVNGSTIKTISSSPPSLAKTTTSMMPVRIAVPEVEVGVGEEEEVVVGWVGGV